MNKLSIKNYTIEPWNNKYSSYDVQLNKLMIHPSWNDFFKNEKVQQKLKNINDYLSYCLKTTEGKIKIYPYPDLLLNAFNITPLENIKVVILGQDPYYNSFDINDQTIPQAMGLSFSVPIGIDIPPSLVNIYKNLLKFGHINKKPKHGNLSFWAYQGCLLLNSTLTVQDKCPNGHEKKWTDITDEAIKYISDNTEHIVFVLWGAPALRKLESGLIDKTKHKVIISSHPSPLSCRSKLRQYGSFEETDHFGEINKYLQQNNKDPIIWKLA